LNNWEKPVGPSAMSSTCWSPRTPTSGRTASSPRCRPGADIVVTGRVADPEPRRSASCMHAFGWSANRVRPPRGGHHRRAHHRVRHPGLRRHQHGEWLDVPGNDDIGFPVVRGQRRRRPSSSPSPRAPAAASPRRTVKEQLLYEIGDPKQLPQSRTAAWTSRRLQVRDRSRTNRVAVTECHGRRPHRVLQGQRHAQGRLLGQRHAHHRWARRREEGPAAAARSSSSRLKTAWATSTPAPTSSASARAPRRPACCPRTGTLLETVIARQRRRSRARTPSSASRRSWRRW
jgi:hypothetical protein